MENCIVDVKYQYLLDEPGWYIHDGYVVRNIKREDGKRTTQRLHTLIFNLEYGNDVLQPGWVVHHHNENKLDNRVSNLGVLTAGEHTSHHHTGKAKPYVAERNRSELMRERLHGTRQDVAERNRSEWMREKLRGNKHGEKLAGDANGRSRVTDAEWLDGIERLFKGEFATNAALARHLDIERTQVGYVLTGKSRKHLQPQIQGLKRQYNKD